ncbi:tyrosine-type recombinase/integrase [Paragemmobacter straminiformis]|uniref:Tyrosine-type recombinase/integrase n=1 Tax=Paragemmobacter straminiformis TaxID=2045119 RepID=A0A842I685_9RHOB|nr:tyrosine-type recombinase/integrase [Gemmobacter straminiformis]MBC2835136.1 tyrosine-type recombinase/integrase [Gemmobacter straminiformis]
MKSNANWKDHFARLDGAFAPSTLRAYFADVQHFETWCSAIGVSAFPVSTDDLCDYLEADGLASSPATVRRRLYAIRKVHRLLRLPDPTLDEAVNITIRRIKRRTLCRPKQAKGLTSEFLTQFLAVQPDTPWGWRNRAMLSLGYDLLTRRSELIALQTSDLQPRGDGTLRVTIRRSKADPFGMGRISFTSRRTADEIARWLDWRGSDIGPLFCGIYQGKAIDRALEATFVKRLIKDAARDAGLDPDVVDAFSGHSMRVGAAQDLLVMGHDAIAIMRAGGWKSVNVLARYLEHSEHNVWEAAPRATQV